MAHLQYLDELVKEYLIFRGFTSTIRCFDNDLKNDKDKSFRVDRITNQILNYIQTYDLTGLRELWAHLDQRLFRHLSPTLLPCVKKFETSMLRFYVINTVYTNKSDKLNEFFDKMAPHLQNHIEWKDWFVLPYLKSVEDIPTFAMYFTRQWQDTLLVSFQNFLAVIYQNMKLPTLATFLNDSTTITKLQEENDILRSRIKALIETDYKSEPIDEPGFEFKELKDDFSQITLESVNTECQSKSLKSLFGLGLNTSASQQTQQPQQQSQQIIKVQGTTTSRGSHTRRSSSSDEKRKSRSSSLASTVRNSDHPVVKRVSQNVPSSGSHVSRSPTKHLQETKGPGEAKSSADASPFLLISRDYYPDHRAIVSHAVFNNAGSVVASADTDGVVKLWSPHPAVKTEDTIVIKGAITALEWLSKTDKYLLIGSKSGCLRLYDSQEKRTVWDVTPDTCSALKDNRIMCVKPTHSDAKFVVSVTPRGRMSQDVNSGQDLASLHVFDMKSQNIEKSFKLNGSVVNNCVLNHNGGLLICGCNDGWIRILDVRSGDIVISWSAHMGEVFTVKLSPHEDKIYSVGSDNKFTSWSLVQTGTRLMDSLLHEKATGPFMVGIGGASKEGSPHASMGGRSILLRPYSSLFALHQDEQHIFTCSTSGPVVYKLLEDRLDHVMSLKGHNSPVLTLDCSAAHQCGSCVASSIDGKVSLSTLLPR